MEEILPHHVFIHITSGKKKHLKEVNLFFWEHFWLRKELKESVSPSVCLSVTKCYLGLSFFFFLSQGSIRSLFGLSYYLPLTCNVHNLYIPLTCKVYPHSITFLSLALPY